MRIEVTKIHADGREEPGTAEVYDDRSVSDFRALNGDEWALEPGASFVVPMRVWGDS